MTDTQLTQFETNVFHLLNNFNAKDHNTHTHSNCLSTYSWFTYFYGLQCMPFYQIYDTNYKYMIQIAKKKIIRHQLSILLEKLNEYTMKKRKKISLIKPTIPLLTIPFVTTFGVINENNFYKIVSLKFQLYNKKDNFE